MERTFAKGFALGVGLANLALLLELIYRFTKAVLT